MASSCWVPDPNKKEYKNWLTVGRAILTTQKGVAPLIQSHIESWHQSLKLIPRLSSCGPCICTSMTSTNCIPCRCTRKSRKSCGSCVCTFSAAPPKCPFCDAWKAELGLLRHHGAIIYDNAWNNCVWKDFDKLPWEVAKLFMAALGSRKSDVKDAASTDLGSLMNLLERCPFIVPPVLRSTVCDVRDNVRNLWAHAANLEISDVGMNNAEHFLHVLLADPVCSSDSDSQAADKELQKLFKDSLICLPNTEFQVLKHRMEVLGEDQKSQNEKTNNLEETTSHIKSGLEKLMKEAKQMEPEETFKMERKRKLQDFDLNKTQNDLKQFYLDSMTHVQMTPWDPSDTCHIDKAYTKLSWVKTTKNVDKTTQEPLQHYQDIFQRNQHRLTIVEGQAGVGKSTFTKRLAVDWAEGREEVLRKFDLLLTIKLREVSSIPTFINVLKTCVGFDNEAEAEQLYQYITENQEKCLIVFDGLDEYEFSSQNDIGQIIKGQKLKRCRVLVTTRPSTVEQLSRYSHAHCKITGFSAYDIKDYAKKYFSSEDEVEAFVNYLKVSSLFSLAKIPLLCLFLCLLWKERNSEDFPTTKTELYKEIVQCILHHSGSKTDCPTPTRKSVDDYDDAMTKLGFVAYEALKRDSLIFDADKLGDVQEVEDVKKLGLLSTASVRSRKPTQSVEFLHKSLQEFAAAWYVAKCLEKHPEKDQLLEDLRLERASIWNRDGHYLLTCHFLRSEDMIRFICGLSNEAAIVVFKKLCNLNENLRAKATFPSVNYIDDDNNSNILSLYNEAKPSSVINKLFFDLCNDTLVVDHQDLPSDEIIVNLFELGLRKLAISDIQNFKPVISLCEKLDVKLPAIENYIFTDAATFVQRLFSGIESLATLFYACIRIVKDNNFILDMYGFSVGESTILNADTLDLIREYPTGLGKLVAEFPEGDIGIPFDKLSNLKELRSTSCPTKLVDGLRFMTQLRKLELGSSQNVIAFDILCDSIQYLTLLEELQLGFVPVGAVVKHVSKLSHLKILKLPGCLRQSLCDFAELSTALNGIPQLVELDLDNNHLGDEVVTILAEHLCKLPQLQSLYLEGNYISANGLENLATALPGIPQLNSLSLADNDLGDGVVSLASHLCSVPQLRSLELCDVGIRDAGVIALAAAFRHVRLLTCLDLSLNKKVDNGSWGKFADNLHNLEQLKKLLLSYCGITENIKEKIKSAVPPDAYVILLDDPNDNSDDDADDDADDDSDIDSDDDADIDSDDDCGIMGGNLAVARDNKCCCNLM